MICVGDVFNHNVGNSVGNMFGNSAGNVLVRN